MWQTVCDTRHGRIDRQRRLDRIWELGGIAWDKNRAFKVQARMRQTDIELTTWTEAKFQASIARATNPWWRKQELPSMDALPTLAAAMRDA